MSSLRKRLLLGALAATSIATMPTTLDAQSPTPEQMQMLQSLPPAQRDAILQQLGISQAGSASSSAGGNRSDQVVVSQPGGSADTSGGQAESKGEAGDRIKGREQLLIDLAIPVSSPLLRERTSERAVAEPRVVTEERSPTDEKKLENLRLRIIGRNPFELTDQGVLQIPGFAPIPLAGLTAKEAQRRLALDPQLREFIVTVTLLRLEPRGAQALQPFGYELFRLGATAFVPGTDIPVPPNYRVGPGDVLDVQLYGQLTKTYTLPVGRDGTVSFPELGPIAVGGQEFGNAQSLLESKVRNQLIGTKARVHLGDLRTQRVLVLGDAEKPGSYVVGSLANAATALFVSGGVKPIGSLRTVEVRRDARLVRRVDLYDALLHGNLATDLTLQSGDVVFVPPVGPTVGIEGEVRRAAIYELLSEHSLADVVALAGGLNPPADASLVTVERVGTHGARVSFNVDFTTPEGQAFAVQSGDMVRVGAVRPVIDNGIAIEGYVYRPGTFAWREGLRLTDLFRSIDDLRPRADTHYVLVRREDPESRRVSVVSADLSVALTRRGTDADIALAPRDHIYVFDLISPRDRIVDPLLEEIRRQSRPEDLASIVYVDGRVNAPGKYPLEPGMRVSDLLRAGGGLEDAAYANGAELASYTVIDGERRRADIRQIDLAAARRGDGGADVVLRPYDLLTIKLTPEWDRQETIELVGEVRFPGVYLVRRGEMLSSVLERAGGLTTLAFPQGAIFTREDLKQRERDELDRMAARLQADIATLSFQTAQVNPATAQSISAGEGLLEQLRTAKPVGRLVIDLAEIAAGQKGRAGDVTLRNGDRLMVPRASEEVSVLGEVQTPTAHLYRRGLKRDDVISLSGGPTAHADKKRTYVVRADGSVVAGSGFWGWGSSGNVALHPGDSVVVPFDAEKMRPLPLWTAVTTIVYNLAIAAAAIGRF